MNTSKIVKEQPVVKNNKISDVKIKLEFAAIDGVPVSFCKPDKKTVNGSLAVWIPYLGGNKETGIRELQQLAAAGYFALSLDPWQHGDRAIKKTPGLRTRVFREFRANMWPILGITTLDTFRVIDRVIAEHNLNGNVVAGGISMGGDIAIALAGIDSRVSRVAAVASTPDWTRPGMTDVFDSKKLIDQGNPTPFGEWLYRGLDPMTNRSSYFRAPAMHLELGADDTHIPPQCALTFKKALSKECPAASQAINIIINEHCGHVPLIQKKSVIQSAIDFLKIEI